MNRKLVEIVDYKREFIKGLKPVFLKRDKPVLDPVKFLSYRPIIAEFKKRSPSAGVIKEINDIIKQVKEYERLGAGMVSVLTDEKYFGGSFADLKKASDTLVIPTLCKDFIISEVQLDYAYVNGADAVLLIAAILSDGELERLCRYARGLSLHILLEVHTLEEYYRVRGLNVDLLGVNSRDLDTFVIDKKGAGEVISQVEHPFVIAESGIDDESDIAFFRKAGAKGFLVGTALMRADNLEEHFKRLMSGVKDVC
ncbi:MAG: indole-3-glycerol-phosphate synthase [Calditerrivibrio sp.]|nr:indole-3-glycerol-phosphate synthase [Calditerrivibrio sp.]